MSGLLKIAKAVADALAAGEPVVALESTVVTHGLPQPEGVQVAALLEQRVREAGATPATIGIFDSAIHVGVTASELERLASATDVVKVNLSNLGATLATGAMGSTTVAATMYAAARVGITVFATGGIGGVHREADKTGDVSADLTALSKYGVAVVCAGAKAVLDLPKTVEMLETLGVPVLGYGTDAFPAFYRRDSGMPVDARLDSPSALALAVRAHFDLGMGSGVVVANPVPAENEMPQDVYDTALITALADADAAGVRGRAVTPFLLDRLRELTQGSSIFSNRALLENNARVAGELATAMAVYA